MSRIANLVRSIPIGKNQSIPGYIKHKRVSPSIGGVGYKYNRTFLPLFVPNDGEFSVYQFPANITETGYYPIKQYWSVFNKLLNNFVNCSSVSVGVDQDYSPTVYSTTGTLFTVSPFRILFLIAYKWTDISLSPDSWRMYLSSHLYTEHKLRRLEKKLHSDFIYKYVNEGVSLIITPDISKLFFDNVPDIQFEQFSQLEEFGENEALNHV